MRSRPAVMSQTSLHQQNNFSIFKQFVHFRWMHCNNLLINGINMFFIVPIKAYWSWLGGGWGELHFIHFIHFIHVCALSIRFMHFIHHSHKRKGKARQGKRKKGKGRRPDHARTHARTKRNETISWLVSRPPQPPVVFLIWFKQFLLSVTLTDRLVAINLPIKAII